MFPVLEDKKLSPTDYLNDRSTVVGNSKFSTTERYASLKTSSDHPEFSYQDLVAVTLQSDEANTRKFCQEKGLIAESQVCENCNNCIPAPTLDKGRGQWYWRCNRKPPGKQTCNNFKFSIKKGTFFENAHMGV